ncbi:MULTISPECIES: YeiH family protein [unclassified Sulfitobacter]|uniref:YeiH family protein n=3 Tax=Sulfitobacter TaxID=60136 RepID=UPI0007C39302|nr:MULTISPECIES: putative sulfate exporter family transporter [unclassified Sulfitobacter]KZX96741.1 hypothetical protein A3721_08490 [Sulfitobacter sp. HI0023]KZZ67569.1 hypothetical protein A3764_00215 [Sulfitobacter sp. HI0129]
MTDPQPASGTASPFPNRIKVLLPGVLIAAIIALASQFIAEHYGAPTMLLALLFGISLNFLGHEAKSRPGIDFGSRQLLRLGVALLGVRISGEVLTLLGWKVVLLVVLAVVATIGFGLAVSRLFGFRYRFAFLSAGAVAICGASAAMAIAAILPRDARSEERLIFTVVSVTLLSTLAMIVYPVLSVAIGFDDKTTGIFIGATVHDVAQVVGAGFSVSEETGNVATLVKLLRVIMLAPVVVVAALVIRTVASAQEAKGKRPPLVPIFVIGFVALAALRSTGLVPEIIVEIASEASRWLLVVAIASVGLKTQPKDILNVGLPAVALLVAETAFLAALVGIALGFLPLAGAG